MPIHSDPLTSGRLKERLRYSRATGLFVWRDGPRAGLPAGCPGAKGYIQVRLAGRLYYAHRLAWLYVTGEWPADELDHRDLDRANNRWRNLRPATHLQNAQNGPMRKRNVARVKGVWWNPRKRKWEASIMANRKRHWLGLFDSRKEAHSAYRTAAVRHFGEFARFA